MNKSINNLEIADLLRNVAASYKIKDANKNKFRIIAYERAADAVEHLSSEAKDLWDEGKLPDVAGIGESISEHLGEIFKTGESKHFNDVMSGLPKSIFELMKVPGVGPKTAYTLSIKFKNKFKERKDPIAVLERLAKEDKISTLENFGKESQEAIIKSIKDLKNKPEKRTLLPYALEIAEELIDWMKGNKVVERADVLGSLRRKASTVGDIDIAASTTKPNVAIDHFTKYPNKTRVLEKGERTASIIIPGGKQADLMVEHPDAYGALLQHFTGSKHHNIAIRKIALKKHLSVSDYGVRELKTKNEKLKTTTKKSKLIKFSTEKELYEKLGMSWIPPELREDNGEIEAAQKGILPKLIELSDINADLHIHSDFDIETSHDLGQSSMDAIVKKADNLGYEYIALTEHNPSHSKHNNREINALLKRKYDKIEQINSSIKNRKYKRVKKVFNSLEIDILPDGSLPVDEIGLNILDFALVSVHSSFGQSKKKMTRRVLSALSQHKVKIFAHPTARKLNERESIELDWDKIFDYCLKNNKWLEINADSMRLDLPDYLVREAVKLGVKLTLGTDSHHEYQMDNMRWGLYVARRGWAEKDDIVNTRRLEEFEKMIDS
jgi:DNA polymerase (family X)